jgi:hypothetical protein
MTESASQTQATRAADIAGIGLIATIALIFAATMLADYAAYPEQLWRDLNHDRNGHFSAGLNLALALKSLAILDFLKDIIQARVWPPVHGLAVAVVMIFGATDVRLAIVPSLTGWACTIVLTFLIARRLFTDGLTGYVAGAIAASFALASPAFRLIAADVMLEGLGAALTAFCLYAYLRARAGPNGASWWSVLAVTLTLLFFEKYNYWLLTAASLAIAFLSERLSGELKSTCTRVADTAIIAARALVRDPFSITAAILIFLDIAIYMRGPTVIEVFDRRVSLYPPENLVTVVWWVLLIRATLFWRAHRKEIDARIGVAGRRLLYWHALPIAFSLLIPKRLSALLWYIGPTHYSGGSYDPLRGLAFQWTAFSQGFHVAPWVAVLVLACSIVAAIPIWRLEKGERAVLILAVVSAAAVVLHPQQQWRFQTTWLFSVWILAGAGCAIFLSMITAWLPAMLRVTVAAVVVAGIAVGQSRYAWTEMAFAAAIHPRPGPSDLDLAKAYLSFVQGTQRVGFLITAPRTSFLSWTVRAACECLAKVDMPRQPPFQTREQYRRDAIEWLGQTDAERIVVIDLPLYSIPSLGLTYERLYGQVEAIEQEGRFERIVSEQVPSLGATVSIWRRH